MVVVNHNCYIINLLILMMM